MGGLIGEFLPLAVGIAISPVPIIAVIMMLTSKGALRNAVFFTAGWVLALVVASVAAIFIFGGAPATAQKGTGLATSIMQVAFGALLVGMGSYRGWQRHEGVAPKQPRLLKSVENIKPVAALAFGLAMIIVNPKNLMLLLSGLMQIGKSQPSTGTAVASVAVFICVASIGTLLPVFVYVFFRQKATSILAGWKSWLDSHNSTVTVYLFLILGIYLLVKGIIGLVT